VQRDRRGHHAGVGGKEVVEILGRGLGGNELLHAGAELRRIAPAEEDLAAQRLVHDLEAAGRMLAFGTEVGELDDTEQRAVVDGLHA